MTGWTDIYHHKNIKKAKLKIFKSGEIAIKTLKKAKKDIF